MRINLFIIALVIAILIFGFAVFYYTKNPGKKGIDQGISGNVIDDSNKNTLNDQGEGANTDSSGSGSDQGTDSGSSSNSGSGGSGGSSGSGGSGDSGNDPGNDNITIPLPDDAYSVPCGMYYKGYQFCNGTCPEGTCISENRSCYCKKV